LTKVPAYFVRTTVGTIVIVIGLVIVVMWALVGLSIVTSRQTALDMASLEGRNLTIAFREEIASILRRVESESNLLADRMRREPGHFNLYAWGQENVLISPGMAEAAIADPDGKLRWSTIEPHPDSIDISDRAHFRIHLDERFHGLYIGKTVTGRISGLPALPMSRRVETHEGTFLGVLVILLSPSALTTLPKSINLGPHGSMTLTGIDDIVRVRFSADSPDGTKGIGTSIAGGPRPAVIEENALGWFVRTSVVDGIARLYTYGASALIRSSSRSGWSWIRNLPAGVPSPR
jgi:hypothetical protein